MIIKRYIALFTSAILCVSLYAQQWSQLANQDFVYYFKSTNQKYISTLDSQLTVELKDLQRKLNYHATNPIDIFVVNNPIEMLPPQDLKLPGSVLLGRATIVLSIHNSRSKIALLFRTECTKILIEEMMYGGTLQDKVKSKNLINLPDWAIPGLQYYLANSWSADIDNTMRYIHDQYGLDDFNNIPAQYNEVKGASFWKYLEYKYGSNAIPSLLYMARLTRKFNTSIYYSFQISVKDLFEDWQRFYNYGYLQDQKKPNPVKGIILSKTQILDIYVEDENTYYTLEQDFFGKHLYQNQLTSAAKMKILSLTKDEVPLQQYSGSIFKTQSGVHLVVNASKNVVLYTHNKEKTSKKSLNIPHVNGIGGGDQVFLIQAQMQESIVYRLTPTQPKQVLNLTGYINSLTHWEGTFYYIREDAFSNTIRCLQYDKEKILHTSSSAIRQLVYAGDSMLLYNSAENGIWNGKMLSIDQGTSKTLTNYRSNIIFHQYSSEVFVEFLDRGSFSSLSIADHIASKDFYRYTDISTSYFYNLEPMTTGEERPKKALQQDSLELYTFQNNVHPTTDFTISNYDSLLDAKASESSVFSSPAFAPDYFSPSLFTLAIVNQPELSEYSVFQNSYRTLLPNNINIKTGLEYTNKYNTKSIAAYYVGALQLGARDISFQYHSSKKLNYTFNVLNRRRTSYSLTERYRYIINMAEFFTKQQVQTHGIVQQKASIWQALEVPLAINSEKLQENQKSNYLTSYTLQYAFNNKTLAQQLSIDVKLNPIYELSQAKKSVTLYSKVYHSWSLGRNMVWINKAEAAFSLGPNPVVFLLGGNATDVLSRDNQREFSPYKSPILYQNVFGVRGFQSNYRNGSSYIMHSSEVQVKLAAWLFNRPVTSEVFSNLAVSGFLDMSTSYYGKSIYDPANILNTRYIVSSTGAIESKVVAFKNPFIASMGLGLGSQFYGYKVNFAYAIGFEDQKIRPGMLHICLGIKI